MPADVETMANVREVPWHGIGTIVEELMTAEEALKAAELDWEVKRLPFYIHIDGKPAPVEVPGKFATVRMSDHRVLGSVGSAYRVLQNRDAFGFADSLVDSGDAKYETAGSLKGGRKVWLMMKIPEGIKVAGDDVDLYLALYNSHDGKSAVQVMVTPVRIVCTNTLNLAISKAQRSWAVRHTSGMDGRLTEARRALELTFGYSSEFKVLGDQLATEEFSGRAFGRLAQELAGEDEKVLEGLLENYSDSETLDGIRNTKWGAVNAVAEYFEWVRPQRTQEARMKNATTGVARKARDRALQLVTAA